MFCEEQEKIREWEDYRYGLLSMFITNPHRKKENHIKSPHEIFHMPMMKALESEREESEAEQRIIKMYNQGLINKDHKTYGKIIKRWLEKSEQ